jgi:hypothetical protein
MAGIPILGRRFGKLIAIRKVEYTASAAQWLCTCDCGNEHVASASNLVGRRTSSCGCVNNRVRSECHRTHGRSKTTEWHIWCAMRQRCDNPRNPSYSAYGGRGITVCDSWRTFANFFADMGERPSLKHTLDRINNNGNYEPTNCRWATYAEQNSNQRPRTRKTPK